jgi:hypothetical protein
MNFLEEELKKVIHKNKIKYHKLYNTNFKPDFENENFVIECKETNRTTLINTNMLAVAGKRLYYKKKFKDKRIWILLLNCKTGYTSCILSFGNVCFDYVIPFEKIKVLDYILKHKKSKRAIIKEIRHFVHKLGHSKLKFSAVFRILDCIQLNMPLSKTDIYKHTKITYGYINRIIKICEKLKIIKIKTLSFKRKYINWLSHDWQNKIYKNYEKFSNKKQYI